MPQRLIFDLLIRKHRNKQNQIENQPTNRKQDKQGRETTRHWSILELVAQPVIHRTRDDQASSPRFRRDLANGK